MATCNECGNVCTEENKVIKLPENVIEYKCDYCYQDMLEVESGESNLGREE